MGTATRVLIGLVVAVIGWAALVLLPLLLVMHKPAHQTSAQMAH